MRIMYRFVRLTPLLRLPNKPALAQYPYPDHHSGRRSAVNSATYLGPLTEAS